jgi:ubiquinol-cytochrome c reductase cytochrome b subunit
MVDYETDEPLQLDAPADENGVASPTARKDRARAALSRFYFDDRVPAVTPSELAAAHHDGHGHEAIEGSHDEDEARPALESSAHREAPPRP